MKIISLKRIVEKVSEQEKNVTIEAKGGDRFKTSSVSSCRELMT